MTEALELTELIARKDPRRRSRASVRFLERLLDEQRLSIEEAALAATALTALGGPGNDSALGLLRRLAQPPARNGTARPGNGPDGL